LTSVPSRLGFRAGAAAPSGVMISFRPPRRCSRIGNTDGQGINLQAALLRHHSAASNMARSAAPSLASSATMLQIPSPEAHVTLCGRI
jgi:hypothetical protein